jgi:hypothetical protein
VYLLQAMLAGPLQDGRVSLNTEDILYQPWQSPAHLHGGTHSLASNPCSSRLFNDVAREMATYIWPATCISRRHSHRDYVARTMRKHAARINLDALKGLPLRLVHRHCPADQRPVIRWSN